MLNVNAQWERTPHPTRRRRNRLGGPVRAAQTLAPGRPTPRTGGQH
jgi:hypothetical protein